MDSMEITVLDDGTIKIVTDRFSPAVHWSAEQFVAGVEKLLGGETTVERKTRTAHTHHTTQVKAGQ